MRPKKQKEKELTLAATVLISLFNIYEFFPRPFEGKTHYYRRQLSGYVPYRTYLNIMNGLEDRGWIRIFKEGKVQHIKLTKTGILEALFIKAKIATKTDWDGKWRMIVFDIPEEAKDKRKQLRMLLKVNGFVLIQKSVYINPYPLNREAIIYLKETGLNEYIRIFRIDEIDDDKDLKKIFNLK